MILPAIIEPAAVYDEPSLILALDIPSSTLTRARREGVLRYARRGRRTYYLGRWVIDWLTKEDRHDADRVS